MLDRIHHIGYAVNDITASIQQFSRVGYKKISDVIDDNIRNVKIVFMEKGDYIIELVAPNFENAEGNGNPVSGVISKNGACPYHICYCVKDMDLTITQLRADGFLPITKAEVAPAIDNRRVMFLYNKTIGIIEIVEE